MPEPPAPPARHPLRVRVLAAGIGAIAGLALFTAGYELWARFAADPRAPAAAAAAPAAGEASAAGPATGEAPPAVPAGVAPAAPAAGEAPAAADPSAYRPAPWFGRFAGVPRSLHALLVPFSATERGDRHNSHGFRVPEYTLARPPATFRVVIVGDSFTWGDGVAADEVYHRRLQARLDAERGSTASRVELIALGVNGSSLLDDVIRLRAHGERLDPDLVVVQYVFNDLEYRTRPALLSGTDGGGELDFFLEATAVGRALRERVRSRELASLVEAEEQRLYDASSLEWVLFLSALDELAGWRDRRSVPVAFVSFPPADVAPEGRNFDGFRELPALFELQARAEREIEARGFPLLRLLEAFRAHAGERYLAVAPDNGHYNALGHELVADALHAFLAELDGIDLGAPRRPEGDPRFAAERALRDRAEREWPELHASHARQRELFEELVALYPGDPWLLESLAHVARRQGDAARARVLAARLAELAPAMVAPWYDLALASDDPARRETLLVRMLRGVPDHTAALESLAGLDAAAGRLARACGCEQRLAELALYPGLYQRATEGLREHACATRTEKEACPGPDPFALPAQAAAAR